MDMSLDPLQMLLGPSLHALRPTAMSQKELAKPVPRLQLVLLGGFASTHQVPQRLMGRIRHPDCRKFARSIASRQFLRIAAVGLDSIASLGRHQARSDYLACHPKLRKLPVQYVTGRASLITSLYVFGWTEFADQLSHRLYPVRNHTMRADFSPWFCHRDGNRVRMDIQ